MARKMRGADAACRFRTSRGLTSPCTIRPQTFYCDTGPIPDRAKVKMNPVVEVKELPLEPPRKKAKRKVRNEAERLRDSFNTRPRIRHV